MKRLRSILVVSLAAGLVAASTGFAAAQSSGVSSFTGEMPTGVHVLGSGTNLVAHGFDHHRGYTFVVADAAIDDPALQGEVTLTWSYDHASMDPTLMPTWGTIAIASPGSVLLGHLRTQGLLERVAGQFGLGGAQEGGWTGTFTGLQAGPTDVIAETALVSDLREQGVLGRVAGQFGLGGALECGLVGSPLASGDAVEVSGLLHGQGVHAGYAAQLSLSLPVMSHRWEVSGARWMEAPAPVAAGSPTDLYPWLMPENR